MASRVAVALRRKIVPLARILLEVVQLVARRPDERIARIGQRVQSLQPK